LLSALKGRRLFNTFGCCRALGALEDEETTADWIRVGTLPQIVAASLSGEHWAIGVCRSLNVWFALDPVKPQGIG